MIRWSRQPTLLAASMYGSARAFRIDAAVTEYGAITSAKTARTSTTRSNAMPTIAPTLPRTRRVERYHACAEKAARVMPTDVRVAKRLVITSVPDSWIEHEIADVRGEVQGDVEDRAEQRNRHDRVEVQRRDRVHRPGSDARPREDGLDEELPRDQGAYLDGHYRHDREHRVAQHVPGDHCPLVEAFRASGADEVLAQHLEHARAGHPRDDGEVPECEYDGGKDQMPNRVRERRSIAGEQSIDREEPRHR